MHGSNPGKNYGTKYGSFAHPPFFVSPINFQIIATFSEIKKVYWEEVKKVTFIQTGRILHPKHQRISQWMGLSHREKRESIN